MQSGIKRITHLRDGAKIVKYSACSKDSQADDDLEDVAVVSNAAPENVKYGTGALTANGPRVVPGIITSAGGERSCLVSDRRTHATSSSPLYTTESGEKPQSASRQSLIDTVTRRVATSRTGSEPLAFVNRAHVGSELEIPRKTRELRRKEIKKELEKWETSTSGSDRTMCKWTFVFDPSGRLCYYWSVVVSIAFFYNFWVIIYRFAFQEITQETLEAWFALDYLADLTYILDIAVHFRTGYLEEGVLQTDSSKLRQHYINSTMFYIDCLCLLPLDCLYLSIGFNSILRCFRLVKIYRFWAFLDRTERHTNYPNVFRALSLTHYVLVIFHWNACLFHIISKNGGFGSRDWFSPRDSRCSDVLCEYLHAFYWSTLALTTIGDLPRPRTRGEYLFIVLELVGGLFLFSAVLGHVANIVTNVSAARKEFQAKLDAVKTYMRMRRVPEHLTNKVIKWFDYLWMTQKSSDEERSVGCLPDKLKAEIAIHVHLDTLKRVEIFQNTEAGFLCELVLRLRPVLFSPGDFICRKGEVGKEMYIVNRGRLQVVTDNGKTVLATLRAGSYFGEISVLNMGTAGNRRTASVRSLGYSDLFCLYKQDMWDVLKDYPAARVRLEAIAVKRLEKYKKEESGKKVTSSCSVIPAASIGRSRSTPGLVESRGKVPLEDTLITASPPEELHEEQLDPQYYELNNQMLSRRPSRISTLVPPPITYAVQPSGSMQSCASDSTPEQGAASTSHSILLSPMPSSPYRSRSPLLHDYINPEPPFPPPPLPLPHLSPPYPGREVLLAEVKRLRERLVTLEAENATMSLKLSQQQWEVENRLAEIEMQLCTATAATTPSIPSPDDNNQESII